MFWLNVECFIVFHHSGKCGKLSRTLWEWLNIVNIVNIEHLLLNWNKEYILDTFLAFQLLNVPRLSPKAINWIILSWHIKVYTLWCSNSSIINHIFEVCEIYAYIWCFLWANKFSHFRVHNKFLNRIPKYLENKEQE